MKSKHLVIDGYNVLHQWKETAALMRKQAIDAACRRLLDEARIIHDDEGIRTTVVFDGKGSKLEVVEDDAATSFAWVYSPAGVSADVIIEQLAMKADKKNEVAVVSMDNHVAASIRASGAYLVSPDEFFAWADRCRKSMDTRITKQKKDAKGWGNTGFKESL